ncbi:MAG TPA: VOC family protein [Puia sp.]|nr:VOC family protein [Puia sp.]
MDALSPNLFVRDIRATLAFYQVLGFTLTMSVPGGTEAEPVWAMVTNGKVSFMFQTFQSLGDTLPQISRTDGGSLLFYINVKDIGSYFESVRDKVQVLHGLQKTFYGATEFSILDNNNYVLTFAEHEQA